MLERRYNLRSTATTHYNILTWEITDNTPNTAINVATSSEVNFIT